tara:strand:+ start:1064 stop:2356 length:1293 start_codon:yes stop_codon:yes gene_type:complete
MINLKLELFNFKKGLDFENQEDIARIVETHFNAIDGYSEKQIINSLNETLSIHSYDEDVKSLLESLNNDLKEDELIYNLKDLFKIIESKNQGMIYRQTLNTLLDIINTEDNADVTNKILNELALHDWVPEVKIFLHNIHNNPQSKSNLLSGGQADDVYTLVESVEGGHVALIDDCWFFMSEEKIEKTLLENHIEDSLKVSDLRKLQTALSHAIISKDRIDFKLDENIVIGISTENPGVTFINEDKLEKETTVANIFNSPIVPIAKKQFFPLIEAISNNLDKIVELDVVKHITNIGNPFVECYVFNYGENLFLYRKDARQGSSLYKYESATEVLNDVRNDLQYDLTFFFENRLDDESKQNGQLEDKIREIQLNIDDVDKNVDKVEANIKMIGESEALSSALTLLSDKKDELNIELKATKQVQYELFQKSLS